MLCWQHKCLAEQVDKYRKICALLTYLEGKEQNYLTQQGFTTENVLVKQVHEQILQNEASKRNLEENYPGLVALNVHLSRPAVGQPIGQQDGDEGLIDLTAESGTSPNRGTQGKSPNVEVPTESSLGRGDEF